ncbi:MAG: hypothetical protein OJI67_09210 [Prosthecobacter sp.]|nr:hypothetical protein [Prosthecobacter sp.]
MKSPSSLARWITILCVAPAIASACMWIHGTTVDGHFVELNGRWSLGDLQDSMIASPADESSLFETHLYHPSDPVAAANDKAVQVLLKGDAEQALKMLEEIEAQYPGAYYTAANRGTAYELAGKDKEALKWILEGIKRNPDSHMKAEWIHVNILKAKIQMKSQPDWLKTHTLTGLDLTKLDSDYYQIESAQGKKNRWTAYESLYRQLRVRMLLVKPKDPIVAQMLTELAYLESQLGVQESAIEYLNMAQAYGADPQATAAFRAHMEKLIRWRWLHPKSYKGLFSQPIIIVTSLCLLLVILVLIRRRRERQAALASAS